ncbi:hypothetical protein LCGC14_0045280 [marine sediment metagenome]|uniref:UDP-3-O-acyl-N-acetylglucosamine deacetylase n=2 Tax=root TaxID=1 RepID=A0A7V1BI07_9RHOB|nr:UDP-3-O-acyl-N-acetylglucosamine deacetylase [Sulfitobacter litoralis]HDZ53572.1 UDP-3-O-acyl-N-acetylglucosamine deacetylase [Sulfitobacter litoralis]
MQHTLLSDIHFKGVGLHGGQPVSMTVKPAGADRGIVFKRIDLKRADNLIPARWDLVTPSRLCTIIANVAGSSVSTIEHIMAALAGCGVHNALIEIDGPEVPIMDGSSAEFVDGILAAGLEAQGKPLPSIRVLKAIEVREGEAVARLMPSDHLEIDFHIDFVDQAIGQQHKTLTMSNGTFVRELSDSRTFCRKADVDMMIANGLALGGTMENAVVFEGAQVLSPGGLRHSDEPVRHKMLDAMGDLALAGAPLMAHYSGLRAGHAMTNKLLRALFADDTAWREEICSAQAVAQLPGAGLMLHGAAAA